MNRTAASSQTVLARAVFALDRFLRKQQGIYEYSTHPECMFRVEDTFAEIGVTLRDGTCVRPGDPILRLHLWNEQMPMMGNDGASIGWARRAMWAVELSLRELARAMAERPAWQHVPAIYGDMKLASAAETAKLLRIAHCYGFETVDSARVPEHALHRVGEGILAAMLVLATNPSALRPGVFRRENQPVYMSRAFLMHRYG
ncbi:MAG TPA: hypothetical protein VFS52_18415 [Steroidobacteraceae bacterium]|jgi:hypothetical protein|nr:hypothetical protein [Steroidobacteraceae bacterium]